jgi:hypothetical protein
MALGTAEHSGHVRGVGYGVTPIIFFNLPRRGSKKHTDELEAKYKEQCRITKELQKMVEELENGKTINPTEKIASNTGKSDNSNSLALPNNVQRLPDNSKSQSHQLKVIAINIIF